MAGPSGPKFLVGAALMAFAALSFSGMHTLIRFASLEVHPFEAAFFRWLFGLFFLLPFIFRRGPVIWKTRHLKLHMVRAVLTAGGTMVWFFTLSVMPLAEATALNFTIPMFTTIAAIFFLGEHVGRRRWTATFVGFVGVLVVLRPGFAQVDATSMLPIVSALFVALNLIVVKFTSRADPTETIVLYNTVLALPLTAIPLLFIWQTPSFSTIAIFAAMGLLATLAHLAMTRAFTYGDASAMIPFDYLRLPFVAFLGFLFFAETPSVWTWFGGAIIAAATIYITHREARLARERADGSVGTLSKIGGTT